MITLFLPKKKGKKVEKKTPVKKCAKIVKEKSTNYENTNALIPLH